MQNRILKLILTSFMLLLFATSCSTNSLQTVRMDKAEEQIILAEQALNQPSANQRAIVLDNAGTATAYLATVRDYRKFLTANERARLDSLQQRVDRVIKQVNQ